MAHRDHGVAVAAQVDRAVAAQQPPRRADDDVHHRHHVGGALADDVQDVGAGGLALQCLVRLLQQTRVFLGHPLLVAKHLQQGLLVGLRNLVVDARQLLFQLQVASRDPVELSAQPLVGGLQVEVVSLRFVHPSLLQNEQSTSVQWWNCEPPMSLACPARLPEWAQANL